MSGGVNTHLIGTNKVGVASERTKPVTLRLVRVAFRVYRTEVSTPLRRWIQGVL